MVNTESKIQQLYTGDVIIELECFFYIVMSIFLKGS
jgi:hypothetical protein